ncbi:UbiH/UbiF/VisC/COQ6 family ubiquinone biosynthesis hydroxylase [Hellea balneolensis]|uniref:UbiH/UbiF/VisC/COQ6 family ubiquinone biosynthesis hydroxylase n=1 Tax=Hellea balneolensis TaxID=287478 RepID=UPI0003FDBACB|nr:UbiH/UbiF/VisC/COQ6 family ubiquinone biosynthesis hydroxylase [Hellea balneolensis]
MNADFDIIVVGAGLVGLSSALACAHKGAKVCLLDAASPETSQDERASAVAASSFAMFEHLGIAETLGGYVQPISDMLIADGAVGEVSPLTLHFDSTDVGGPTGHMVENNRLRPALLRKVQDSKNIRLLAPVEILKTVRTPKGVTVTLKDKTNFTASLLVAADGRNSNLRQQAGIDVQRFAYEQKAIVTTFKHELTHDGVAHQIFFAGGPLALLPLTGQRCSIVWSDAARAVDAAMGLDEAAFTAELARRIGGFLGEIKLSAPRQAFPLSLQMAERYTDERLVLVGDAAHSIHPIAGQGLNMGLRDAAALADVVESSLSTGLDLGGAAIGDYEAWRNFDNKMLGMTTDMLNRLFTSRLGPLRHARRVGLAAVNRFKPAQAFFMKEAAGQSGDLPSLLQR